jgi:hypothetical protein
MGHVRADLTSYTVLFWPVGDYLVIYRAERRPIEIVAVTQGSRDIPTFLSSRMRASAPRALSQNLFCYGQLLDIRGALVNAADFRVAIELLHRIVLGEADAAEDLDRA